MTEQDSFLLTQIWFSSLTSAMFICEKETGSNYRGGC